VVGAARRDQIRSGVREGSYTAGAPVATARGAKVTKKKRESGGVKWWS